LDGGLGTQDVVTTTSSSLLQNVAKISFATEPKFLFKCGLARLRQLAEQASPDQVFALINFHRDAVIQIDP
jgi:hypothetical protein